MRNLFSQFYGKRFGNRFKYATFRLNKQTTIYNTRRSTSCFLECHEDIHKNKVITFNTFGLLILTGVG